MLEHRHQISEERWLTCFNQSGAIIPAYAAMEVASVGADTDGTVYLNVVKPTADHLLHIVFNGPQPVGIAQYGICSRDLPALNYYDTYSDTPPLPRGRGSGTKANEWFIVDNRRHGGWLPIGEMTGINATSGRAFFYIQEPYNTISAIAGLAQGSLISSGERTLTVGTSGSGFNTDSYIDAGSVTIPKDGTYHVTVAIEWARTFPVGYTGNGYRGLTIRHHPGGAVLGTQIGRSVVDPPTTGGVGDHWPRQQVTALVECEMHDVITCAVDHDVAGSFFTARTPADGSRPNFFLRRVGA